MCELLGMSSRLPAGLSFSFSRFASRGGRSGPHADGWGVAFMDEGDARIYREPVPAASSEIVSLLERQDVRSQLVISHIRLATQGGRALRNTQPFVRELGGRAHVFAHNGDLKGAHGHRALIQNRFRTMGDTDSEVAFCALLERMAPLWGGEGDGPPTVEERIGVVAEVAAILDPLGPANFLYTDGELLFAFGNRRTHPDGVRPPGLWRLGRRCEVGGRLSFDGVSVHSPPLPQEVTLLASVPLTGEDWRPLAAGELLVLSAGRVVSSRNVGGEGGRLDAAS